MTQHNTHQSRVGSTHMQTQPGPSSCHGSERMGPSIGGRPRGWGPSNGGLSNGGVNNGGPSDGIRAMKDRATGSERLGPSKWV